MVNYLRGGGAPSAITAIYIDLFDGNPEETGQSILADLTGSSTRIDITSNMGAANNGVSVNESEIVIVNFAQTGANLVYFGIYTASTGGSLIMSSPVTSPGYVVADNGVAFPVGSIQIMLS